MKNSLISIFILLLKINMLPLHSEKSTTVIKKKHEGRNVEIGRLREGGGWVEWRVVA